LNFVDIIVLGVLGISTLLAFSRGFIKEMMSILGWVGAVIATVFLFAPARPYVREYIAEPLLADLATGIGIFVVTLFLCGAVNHWISGKIRGNGLGAFDRSLGLVFGLARGALLISIAYIFMAWAFPDPKDRPEAIGNARTLPLVERMSDWLKGQLPSQMLDDGEKLIDEGVKKLGEGAAIGDSLAPLLPGLGGGENTLQSTPEEAGGQGQGSGYKDAERDDLNRLIQGEQ
jgi:membrane protein required for colicin V production